MPRRIQDLPTCSSKTGWPWDTPDYSDRSIAIGHPLKLSIVTPNYNGSQFLEETLRSVLLQAYPSVEHIVIDGGSKDDSVDIIRKYAPWLDYWVSEPDRGQAHAINKGFARCTGDVVAFLNSDDIYLPGACYVPPHGCLPLTKSIDWVVGACYVLQLNDSDSYVWLPQKFDQRARPWTNWQPKCSSVLSFVRNWTRCPAMATKERVIWASTSCLKKIGWST